MYLVLGAVPCLSGHIIIYYMLVSYFRISDYAHLSWQCNMIHLDYIPLLWVRDSEAAALRACGSACPPRSQGRCWLGLHHLKA